MHYVCFNFYTDQLIEMRNGNHILREFSSQFLPNAIVPLTDTHTHTQTDTHSYYAVVYYIFKMYTDIFLHF